ncbi:MAG: carboxy-S-adenosyl-L-methionine synthase CmoA [SAR86 cluster bacterium]|uniref:Carboxy-S-adenosyl-L-methionine synthase n=1 Tax=SAR86 cluster bacterium TaxID=2030880 RepID=A0A2A4MPV2_9GAMM|nr:MAG: carboxy-S-adenosyl-L-methionine synthase CmoA [SAR86 cluster bacterium]
MSKSDNHTDRLFSQQLGIEDFVFDAKVANVFSDMINRSVPGYSTIISMIAVLAQQYCREDSTVYDLGCSLGAATVAMGTQINCSNYKIVAVDNSSAMVDKLTPIIQNNSKLASITEIRCEDILHTEISNASVVVLNFTLQFIPVEQRDRLLRHIYQGMKEGGIVIISEKIVFEDAQLNQIFIDTYHRFKASQGYSALEIAQKRSALENVLMPESIDIHRRRMADIGFKSFDAWFQCFNFASFVAFK